jgi:hypothetical protein
VSKFLAKLNQEPALLVGFVSALVAVLVGFNVGLTSTTGALVVAFTEAVLGVYLARQAQETLFAALTQAFKVLLALAVGFGLHLTDQNALLLTAAVSAGLAFVARTQINPEAGSPTPEATYEPVYSGH